MTLDEAEDLTARTLAAIEHVQSGWDMSEDDSDWPDVYAADRERVASDLAGLREHQANEFGMCDGCSWKPACSDAVRYSDGLRRTAAIYGVTS